MGFALLVTKSAITTTIVAIIQMKRNATLKAATTLVTHFIIYSFSFISSYFESSVKETEKIFKLFNGKAFESF